MSTIETVEWVFLGSACVLVPQVIYAAWAARRVDRRAA